MTEMLSIVSHWVNLDHERFRLTAPFALQVYGNWNAPEAVTAAAVIYCVRCLVSPVNDLVTHLATLLPA